MKPPTPGKPCFVRKTSQVLTAVDCGKYAQVKGNSLPSKIQLELTLNLSELTDQFRTRNHGKVLATIRAVLDMVADGKLANIPDSALDKPWALLVKADEADHHSVQSLLSSPFISSWASFALRQACTRMNKDEPVWITIGYLNSIAAAAGILASVPFDISIPTRSGVAILPMLGAAILPNNRSWDQATVHHEQSGTVLCYQEFSLQIPDNITQSSLGWLPFTQLTFDIGDRQISLWIDDLSPYRTSKGVSLPDRLSPAKLTAWQTVLREAYTLLARNHPNQFQELADGLVSIAPVPVVNPFQLPSATSADAFGHAEMGLTHDPAQCASTLIHEFSHSKLNALLEIVPLDREDRREIFQSPWREDPRPLRGLLHGLYSFINVTEFWRIHRHKAEKSVADFAHFEFALRREQTRKALAILVGQDMLTDDGRKLVDLMAEQMSIWDAEQVPVRPYLFANRALIDHNSTWRLNNLETDPVFVSTLRKYWNSQQECPGKFGPDIMRKGGQLPNVIRPRTHLSQMALGTPELFASLSPDTVHEVVPGASSADLWLTLSKFEEAQTLYCEILQNNPRDVSAWAGLGLATQEIRACKTHVLLTKPEVVRALYLNLLSSRGQAPDPLTLADWLNTEPAMR